MANIKVTFRCPDFYNLHMVCHTHGWKYLAPFSWDDHNQSLKFAAFIGKEPVDIEVKQSNDTIKAFLTCRNKPDKAAKNSAKPIISRTLGLDIDVSELMETAHKAGPEYVALIKNGAGRLLRSPTLWEDAAKTLFTTNCSWALTVKMCAAACSDKFSTPSPSGTMPFPSPDMLAKYDPGQLKEMMPVGYRAAFLKELADTFAADPTLKNIEGNGLDYPAADKRVRSLKGFGDYATAHILILAGYYDKVPLDTVVVSYLKKNHRVRKPQSFIDRHYRKWGKYKWWGLKLEKMINRQNWLGD